MNSPTTRSLRHLRSLGYYATVVERWNPYARVRQDLFGWIDIVACHREKQGIIGVQTTTATNRSARVAKARGNAALLAWLLAGGRLVVHAWKKTKGRWTLAEQEIGIADIIRQENKRHGPDSRSVAK